MARLRSTPARVGAAIAVMLAVVVIAAGCGSSSGSSGGPDSHSVSATAYVGALCRAVAPFEKEVASRSGALDRTGATSLTEDKAQLVSYLGALAGDSASALARLRSAGVPEVSGGQAFATTIVTTFERVHTALSRSETLATNLPTQNSSAFTAGADKLAAAVKASLGQLGSGFHRTASNRALNAAAAKVAACHTL